jgi:hypothetical protein
MESPEAKDGGAGDRAEAGQTAALPYEKAFVVQFTAETDASLAPAAGRVEHLLTGRRSRFASIDEFLACITSLLGDHGRTPPKRARRSGRKEPS